MSIKDEEMNNLSVGCDNHRPRQANSGHLYREPGPGERRGAVTVSKSLPMQMSEEARPGAAHQEEEEGTQMAG